ncbi:hypothetical protein THAOC_04584 [Thalassiosira oceanica]|uniref:Uncharacterized protein n=1 Tax=Thalassiosira oceanica TaxID=159749 RepID=K0T879_THAOC|nr:hypothetical protein THAOC_04584 [Thalassiosira oceanica]|mmetsp:Transcript_36100/g.86054  ORF Transcript_36100/g.86054 Transcript_36100/m.86054 type:complete len:154 (-) Transcript_36100:99-560(-)|eukprot:EJK73775.1 hypothetical protein THAOC_04584 [Thalassiosira oceanica]
MKTIAIATLALCSTASAFTPPAQPQSSRVGGTELYEYIPSGMSKAQWQKIKEQEKNKNKGKNLGATGITSFKSRSFEDWQKSGGKNLFPVDPRTVKNPKDLPYMQRAGGAADDSDLKGGNKKSGPTFFKMGGAKKKAEPTPEPEKKKNWWTLN